MASVKATTSTPQFDPAIYALDATQTCSPTMTCLIGDDEGVGTDLNSIGLVNESSLSKEYLVVVDSYVATTNANNKPSGDFTLTLSTGTAATGSTCSSAPVISASTTYNGVTEQRNYAFKGVNCAQYSGGERVYQYTVAAGATLTATVTPGTGQVAVVNLVAGSLPCLGQAGCLKGSASPTPGAATALTWQNSSASPSPVFIVVSDANRSNTLTFQLSAQ